MLDIGWTEMFVVAVVAIVVIGPKELPAALRTAGRWARKARAAARGFQNSIDDMVNQAELDELRKNANEIRNFDANRYIADTVDPTGAGPSAPPPSGETAKDPSNAVSDPPDTAKNQTADGKPAAPSERETNA